jgi:predicted aminopeptidase
MLDLVIGHEDVCEKCGRITECARVSFWDESFTGMICWEDLQALVRENSKDPEARKKFAYARRERDYRQREKLSSMRTPSGGSSG